MFITLEGIEGSGKTTQLKHIAGFLREKGLDCVTTREPGGTEIGRKIRAILLDLESRRMDPLTELLLYMADRAQHLNELVRPCLEQGKTVLCDRYYDATVAYQGFARRLDIGLLNDMHRLIFNDLKPDLTLLLDLPPKIGLQRALREIENGGRDGSEVRFENEKIAFHEKVRAGYLELARLEPARFRIIDAAAGENQVRREILKAVTLFLKPTGR
jgi:dTMP kinase